MEENEPNDWESLPTMEKVYAWTHIIGAVGIGLGGWLIVGVVGLVCMFFFVEGLDWLFGGSGGSGYSGGSDCVSPRTGC